MTVCVAVQVMDCLVFAADSAASMIGVDPATGAPLIMNVYDHGKKVFCLHNALPVMAMTCGMGSIQGSSIDVLAKDFRLMLMGNDPAWGLDPAGYTMQEITEKAYRYFHNDQYLNDPGRPAGDHSFELFIGGISSGERRSEIWKISIINGVGSGAVEVFPRGQTGIVWAGQPEAINRLVFGFSAKVPEVLEKTGIPTAQIQPLMDAIKAETQAALTHPAMPVQDALDLASFLARATIDFTKFLPGANTVGGAVDLATVTRHEGFKWVRRKHYYPSELNPLETDHVGGRKA
jgi:hypothetical protein